ncbi:30S ribosomal protein S7 [Verrucomicrobia bacterium LW23]|nr:30S ribosomal protein S7 [Verrucomicrobia bacterium LW23]
MARRRRADKREMAEDSKYESPVVGRLISTVMRDGKMATAQRVVYGAIDEVNQANKDGNPLDILTKAIDNVKPRLEVKSRRVGGATYQVPMEVPPERQISLAMRWLVQYASKRKGVTMVKALASEVRDASNGQGNAVKKRDDVHKMAQANRAFAHFRF